MEDNAHGLFARFKGKLTGTFGSLATQSFHETKNITCGEGGALLISDPKLVERAMVIREKGTNRNRFLRGQVDKYTWVDIGSSYLPSDMLAAFLLAQLEARVEIERKRRLVWEYYREHLKGWAGPRRGHTIRSVRMRAVVSHVLSGYEFAAGAAVFDLAPEGAGNPERISLRPLASLSHGTANSELGLEIARTRKRSATSFCGCPSTLT